MKALEILQKARRELVTERLSWLKLKENDIVKMIDSELSDIDKAIGYLKSYYKDLETKNPDPIELIKRKIISHYQISETEFSSADRNGAIVEARQLFFWYLLTYTNTSTVRAGQHANRCHGTAIHGKKVINNRLTYDKELKQRIKYIFNINIVKL